MVSENAAASAAVSSVVEGLPTGEEEDEGMEESLQNTATRLAEDLAQVLLINRQCSHAIISLQVISSRVTGMVGEEGRSSAPQYSFAGSAGGLLSSLQELLPTSQVVLLDLMLSSDTLCWLKVDLNFCSGTGREQFRSSEFLRLHPASFSLLSAAHPPLHLHRAAAGGRHCAHLPVCNTSTTFPYGRQPATPQ